MKLDDIATLSLGKTPSRSNPKFWDKEKNSKNIWLSIADLSASNQLYIEDSKEYVSDEGAKLFKEVPEETLIMSFKLSIGKLAITKCSLRTNEAIIAMPIKDKKLIMKEYLYYYLSSMNWDTIAGKDIKVKGKTLNKTKLKELPIPVPPLEEQERIVAKLDAAFAEIDEAKKIIDKNNSSYSNLLSNIIRNVLNNDLYQWEINNLSNLSENLDSKRIPITKSKRLAGNVPYYGASGIVDYVEEFLFDDDLLLISEDGANLIMRTYPIAFSIKGKSWVNNHAHVLKFACPQLQQWVEFYLNSINLSPYISGMAQPKLNQKKLYEIPIPCPNLEILGELLKVIEGTKKHIEEILVFEMKKINELKRLKSAILSQELNSSEAA